MRGYGKCPAHEIKDIGPESPVTATIPRPVAAHLDSVTPHHGHVPSVALSLGEESRRLKRISNRDSFGNVKTLREVETLDAVILHRYEIRRVPRKRSVRPVSTSPAPLSTDRSRITGRLPSFQKRIADLSGRPAHYRRGSDDNRAVAREDRLHNESGIRRTYQARWRYPTQSWVLALFAFLKAPTTTSRPSLQT